MCASGGGGGGAGSYVYGRPQSFDIMCHLDSCCLTRSVIRLHITRPTCENRLPPSQEHARACMQLSCIDLCKGDPWLGWEIGCRHIKRALLDFTCMMVHRNRGCVFPAESERHTRHARHARHARNTRNTRNTHDTQRHTRHTRRK